MPVSVYWTAYLNLIAFGAETRRRRRIVFAVVVVVSLNLRRENFARFALVDVVAAI